MRHTDSTSGGLAANALKGALAGAVGVWAMDRIDWFLWRRQDPAVIRRIEEVRPGGLDPAHVAVNRVAGALGGTLSPAQPHPAGLALHYGIGIGPGALYGALRERVPAPASGDHLLGLGFGLGLFLLADETIGTAAGLAADPRRYPWQAHARGLIAHLVYGAVTNTVLNLLGAPRPAAPAAGPAPHDAPPSERLPPPGALDWPDDDRATTLH